MGSISYNLINRLNDDEIQRICKETDLELFLTPFRKNQKKYDKYIRKLGRLDKGSSMVKKFLPKFAYDLYKKGDEEFVDAISTSLESHKASFLSILTQCKEPIIDINVLKVFKNNEFVELYFNLIDISSGTLHYNIFECALKICDVFPGTENMILIKGQIDKIEEKKKQEEQFKRELESELKKYEKQLSQKAANEKELMKKMLRELRSELAQSQKNESILSDELDKLQHRITNEKQRMISEWKADIETEIMKRKRILLDELKAYEKKERNCVEERITALANQLRDRFDAEFEVLKYEAENRIEELEIQISKLESHKAYLEGAISLMEEQEDSCRGILKSLERTEEEFFANIKLRCLERKLNKFVFDDNEINESTKGDEVTCITSTDQQTMTYEWRTFAESAEEGERINCVEDFIDDFSDNISINFEHATEIALLIISALFDRKAIILESSIAQYVVESLSEIIDGSVPQVIEVNSAKADGVIKAINDSNHKVIFIDGVLNNYDEVMFASICRQSPRDKYLFFGVSQINDVKMFSKTTLNNAFILDIETYMIISSHKSVIVGNNDLEEFNEVILPSICKANYDKFFKALVGKSIISKKSAFDISRMLCIYLKYMSSIGEVAKQCVSYYWNDHIDEEIDVSTVLEKAGWI